MHTVAIKMIHPLSLPDTFSLTDKKQPRIGDPHSSAMMQFIVLAQHLYIPSISFTSIGILFH